MTKKIIALSEFLELSEKMQFRLLHRDGVFVGKRKIDGKTVVLLQLYGFYVEVHYKVYRKEIDHLITSSDTEILQPYLHQINIGGLDKGETDK